MPGPDCFLWLIAPLSFPPQAPCSADLWAYIGLGPGQEFIPQFLAMLGLAATALLAVVQWPILALWSRLSRALAARKKARTTGETLVPPTGETPVPLDQASAAQMPEQPGEDHPDKF
jgi:hypothetical protein